MPATGFDSLGHPPLMPRIDDAEFYVLLRVRRDHEGSVIAREFVQARKTKPEPGALRTGPDEAWLKLTAYVPTSFFFAGEKAHHEPIGVWAEALWPQPSDLSTA